MAKQNIHEFFRKNRTLTYFLGMFVATLVYCFGLVFVLGRCNLFAGGVSGISQLLATLFRLDVNGAGETPIIKSLLLGIFIFIINIPLFIFGWKSVSKKFAIVSLSSVVLQTVFSICFQLLQDNGFDPFAGMVVEVETPNGVQIANEIVFAILGGAMTGFGCGFALRCGASTGGMDIVSQKISLNSSIPFSYISGSIDAIIIVFGAIVHHNIATAVYTLVRWFVHVVVLDKIYTIYKYQKISIVTKKRDEMQVALLKNFCHGVTIFQAVGGYSDEVIWNFETVVLTYELEDYKKIIREVDPHAFVSFNSVKNVTGNYVKKVIN